MLEMALLAHGLRRVAAAERLARSGHGLVAPGGSGVSAELPRKDNGDLWQVKHVPLCHAPPSATIFSANPTVLPHLRHVAPPTTDTFLAGT